MQRQWMHRAGIAVLAAGVLLAACAPPTAPSVLGREYRAVTFNGARLPATLPSIGRWQSILQAATYSFHSPTTVRVSTRYRTFDAVSGLYTDTEAIAEQSYRWSAGNLTIFRGPCVAVTTCGNDTGIGNAHGLTLYFEGDSQRTLRLVLGMETLP